MDIPSLFMIPSAVSSGKVHSVFPNSTDADFDFNRDSDATRVNSEGLIERVGYYGSELVVNGGFDTDSNWIKGGEATISGGVCRILSTSGSFSGIYQTVLVVGKTYIVTFDVTNVVSGNLKVGTLAEGASDITSSVNSLGSKSFTFTAIGTVISFARTSGQTDISIDNVSVKEITGDRARLNYEIEGGLVNTKPSLLLEPQSTNLFPYSNDYTQSNWNKDDVTITENAGISPENLNNASKMVVSSASPFAYIYDSLTSSSSIHTISAFVKADGRNIVWLYIASGSENGTIYFDLSDESMQVVSGSGATPTGTITAFPNDWYRITYTTGSAISFTGGSGLGISDAKGNLSATVDGTNGVLIYGLQIEQQSYATSYIPTNGSTQTRAAETCNGAGTSSILPSEEGILYCEIAALGHTSTSEVLSISNGSGSNTLYLGFSTIANKIVAQLITGGGAVTNITHILSNTLNFNKIAVLYKTNNHKLVVNGVVVGTDTSGATFSAGTLDRINFDLGQGSFDFYGKIRDIRVYNTKEMTDSEVDILLTKITS